MQQIDVGPEDVLAGFDALADIYGHVPSLIMWRAWEYAFYRRYRLPEPMLDVGCGDGRFLSRVFPEVRDVVGVDESADVVELARQSGVYRRVHAAPAHVIPEAAEAFASAFANCSLEHMDRLDDVLGEIHRVLRPGGVVLLSVVTDSFVSWAPLRLLLTTVGATDLGHAAQADHEAYHHLVSAFPRDDWMAHFDRAGFTGRAWAPVVTGLAGWCVVLFDQLWHVKGEVECGEALGAFLQRTPNHVSGLRRIFHGLLEMSAGATDHAGIVFCLEK